MNDLESSGNAAQPSMQPAAHPVAEDAAPNSVTPSVSDLLPHGPRAQLLRAVTAWDEGQLRAAALLRAGCVSEQDGLLDAALCLEVLGQAVAAHARLLSLREPTSAPSPADGGAASFPPTQDAAPAGPPRGFIVSVPEFSFEPARLPEGAEVEVSVQLTDKLGALAGYSGVVSLSGVDVARATLRVFSEGPSTSGATLGKGNAHDPRK